MGLDWTLKCAKSWRRQWDKAYADFTAPSLFPMNLNDVEKTLRVVLNDGEKLVLGDQLIVQSKDGALAARLGNRVIGAVVDIPASVQLVVNVLDCACFCAVVCEVFEVSGDVDAIIHE